LEERLARGEVLEDNQVAKLASMQKELNQICKQLLNNKIRAQTKEEGLARGEVLEDRVY